MSAHPEKWPAGTPCWVDIMVPDLGRSQTFYRAVLGWEYTESVAEFGGYCNAMADGRVVAGLSPMMEGMGGAPTVWTTYLATDDIDATAAAVTANGGQVTAAPMQIPEMGSMAVFVDPTGASFGVWQSGSHTGFDAVDEPGTIAWNDVMSTDDGAARRFYQAVFGFTYEDLDMGGMRYAMFSVDGGERPAGGIGEGAGAGGSAWNVAFMVADVDDAVGTIAEAGGTVTDQPSDFEFGRILSAAGPDGERFQLVSPQQKGDQSTAEQAGQQTAAR
ncbi:glyoxalase [Tersicoccus solisilvae]|uniref:Glyoxalase n=1 Tax=Tersicoccus solisilvae TaxID=1882339 RepID=A0ABQ1NJA3_9MICC|nr:VOC family protein [Tersicoccus solisilvae]GGC78580.1 glyoxalase [Tersicoccus solisilvae]